MTQSIFLQSCWECRTQWSQRSRPVVLKWLQYAGHILHITTFFLMLVIPASKIVVTNFVHTAPSVASMGTTGKLRTKENVLWLPWLCSLFCVISDANENERRKQRMRTATHESNHISISSHPCSSLSHSVILWTTKVVSQYSLPSL